MWGFYWIFCFEFLFYLVCVIYVLFGFCFFDICSLVGSLARWTVVVILYSIGGFGFMRILVLFLSCFLCS